MKRVKDLKTQLPTVRKKTAVVKHWAMGESSIVDHHNTTCFESEKPVEIPKTPTPIDIEVSPVASNQADLGQTSPIVTAPAFEGHTEPNSEIPDPGATAKEATENNEATKFNPKIHRTRSRTSKKDAD